MAPDPPTRDVPPAGELPLERARGLAELAFGSFTQASDLPQARHLALLPAKSLELDLNDPAQRQFGDYELLELLGEGGMGVVYRAQQVSLDREVAVKLLSAGPWASREFIVRFEREARNAARMQHPGIVTIYEVGSFEGVQFFSMRLVRGESLSACMRRGGKFTPREAAALLRTIAEAVGYAHSLGVLHLDLKPANVLLDEVGQPYVADFGLARRLENALAVDNDEVSGTPAYMAPEQAQVRANKLTAATDIWGLGAILYQLLTGQPPFRGETAQDTVKLVLEGQVRAPRRWRPLLPLDLQAIVMRCLARDPRERYPTARALADELQRYLEGRPVLARPLNAPQKIWRWARREPKLATTIACAMAALIIGLVAATTQWRRADANARVAQTNAALANQRLWQARIDQAQVAVRTGHNYDALPGLAANIREREVQGLDAHEDRVRIAMVERAAPRLIDAIATGSTIYGVALSPDGSRVAVATEDQRLRVFDTATGKQAWQASFAGATHFQVAPGASAQLEVLRYSADGRYLIGRNHNPIPRITPNGLDEVLFDAAKGKLLVPPARVVPKFSYATYSPDGEFAVVRTADGRAVLMRTSGWQVLGTWRDIAGAGPLWLVTTHALHVLTNVSGRNVLDIRDPRTLAIRHSIHYATTDVLTSWASSPDGTMALIGHQDGQLDLVDCGTGRYRTLSPNAAGRIGWVAFSPDGRWMGAVADSGEVLVWDTATGKLAAPMMHLDITPEYHREQLFIDAASRTVIASADFEMGLWYLPDATTAPVRLSGELPNAGAYWMRAFAYRSAQGLIASDGGRGDLFLWRVQQLAPRGIRAPAMPPGQLHVVAGRVVAVDGASVRVVNAADGRPVGPALQLPQAPAFAQLTANNASLVAVAGREVYVYDAATWKLRRAPIVLPNDPARVLLSPDARHALLLFADYHDGGNRELGQIWDLVEGKPVTPTVGFEYLTRFRYSADGRGLLLWKNDHLQWLDALSLRQRWASVSFDRLLAGMEHAKRSSPAAPVDVVVTDAQLAAGGSRIEVLTSSPDDNGPSRFWRLDVATGKIVQQNLLSETDGGEAFATVPSRHGVIVQRVGMSTPLWWDPRHGAREMPGYGKQETSVLALSPDTTMFARATEDRVVLTSTRDLEWLSSLLPTEVPALDAFREQPTQLAFTPDGNGLVARMRQREWLYWDVRPDLRPIDQIAREAALLNPDQTKLKHGLATPLPASERQALRADDPGPPVFLGAFPAEAPTPRQPDLPPRLFDLTPYFDAPLVGLAGHNYTAAAYQELTPGVHRFLGVDYDVRGIIALAEPSFAPHVNPDHPPPQAVRGIRPGIDRFSALNLLMTSYDCEEPFNTSNAIVEFDYADGSRARQALLCGRDFVPNYADDDAAKVMQLVKPDGGIAPAAWRATNIGSGLHWISTINAVRVVNPHPERSVASIALEATGAAFSSPLFFAITAEPVASAASSR